MESRLLCFMEMEKIATISVIKLNIKTDELSKITVPTLVICGTNDMIKESHTREIADNIMNSKLMIIKGNHFVANKNPEEFNKAVDGFLTNRGNVI